MNWPSAPMFQMPARKGYDHRQAGEQQRHRFEQRFGDGVTVAERALKHDARRIEG
ncbi:MAG: hypothetical protein Q9P14_07640 [candidate division KSB1 bacterium]|nr:hypothetical protein [candidate division KSB1 bacterium]